MPKLILAVVGLTVLAIVIWIGVVPLVRETFKDRSRG